jgi:putative transposase
MKKSTYIHKSHNVSVLLYHIVFPAKYRRFVLSDEIEVTIKAVCIKIEARYEIKFLEIGADKDHIHLLVQSVLKMSITNLVTIIKSITAKEVFKNHPEVKKLLWGGEFWSDGFFASTVGKHGDEDMISKYVQNQGKKDYKKLHADYQLRLFD